MLAWKRVDPNSKGDHDTQLVVEFATTTQVHAILAELEQSYARRNVRYGYSVNLEGTCAKGPQQINWRLEIEFEEGRDADGRPNYDAFFYWMNATHAPVVVTHA